MTGSCCGEKATIRERLQWFQARKEENNSIQFAIEYDGRYIGDVDLNRIDQNDRSAWMIPKTLLQELRILGIRLTPELAKRMRRFDWTTDLRYETGRRNRGETRGFLRTCVEIRDWVKGELS